MFTKIDLSKQTKQIEMPLFEVTDFYCKRYCNGYLELIEQDEPNKPCEIQCVDCACEVGKRRIKTKEFLTNKTNERKMCNMRNRN